MQLFDSSNKSPNDNSPGVNFDLKTKTVILFSRELIDILVPMGSTVKYLNELAVAIIDIVGEQHGVSINNDAAEWSIGTSTKNELDHLMSRLITHENVSTIKITA